MTEKTLTYTASSFQHSNWTLPDDARVVVIAAAREAGGEAKYQDAQGRSGYGEEKFRVTIDGEVYESYRVKLIGILTYEVTLSTEEKPNGPHDKAPFRERLNYYLANNFW